MPIDSQNMINVLEEFAGQCRQALELPRAVSIKGKITKIIVAGMGGSAIGGDILRSYMHQDKTPVFVNKDYTIPGYADEGTLVFAVSYSGNTEETLSAVSSAIEKSAKIVAITSGGKLGEIVKQVIKVPYCMQPRAALGYLFLPMLGVLHNSGVKDLKNADLNEMIGILKKKEEFKQNAMELAKKLNGKIPIIYSSELLMPAAYRFRTQIEENAKLPAFHHVFAEMNHNEINAYKGMDRRFAAVLIRDRLDHERIKRRMDICKEIMEGTVDVLEIHAQGTSLLSRLFSAIYLGDLTSYYLAIQNRTDPSPVEVIEVLKKKLA